MEDRDRFAKFADHKFPAGIGDEMQSLMDRMHDEAIKMAAGDGAPATPAEQPDQRAGEVEQADIGAVLAWAITGKSIYGTGLLRPVIERLARAALHPSQESHGVEGEVECPTCEGKGSFPSPLSPEKRERIRAALGKEGA